MTVATLLLRSRNAVRSRHVVLAQVDAAVAELKRLRALGVEPPIEALWAHYAPGRAIEVLAALAKADLQVRFDRGERPEAASYLDRFTALRDDRERVVSLIFEEFCLREERGERPEPDAFCGRYESWGDSLRMQIGCHDMLSQAVGATTPTRALPTSGDRFRSFRLGAVLGQGGSGRVFLANDESLGDRRVALKVSIDRGTEPAIQGRLDHAHIVPVLSVIDDPDTGLRGLCMPYRAGLPLDEVIRRIDPARRPRGARVLREILPLAGGAEDPRLASWHGFPDRGTYPQGVAWVGAVLARALAHAHGQGVFHRDVKPANVLLAAREGPQLLDFNLSHARLDPSRAEAALRGGTLPYMAPEQLSAFLDPSAWDAVGEAADTYSLGLLLRELLTGNRPDPPEPGVPLSRGINAMRDRRALGFGSIRAENRDVPHALDAIVARALAFRPEDRYSSARALAEDLERFLARRPLIEAVNPSPLERTSNWLRRRGAGRVAIFTGALAVAGVVAGSLLLAREDSANASKHVAAATDNIKNGQWENGLAETYEAERLAPSLYTTYQARSKIQIELHHPSEALADITKAVDLAAATRPPLKNDQLALVYLDQACLLRQMKLFAQSKVAYRNVLKLFPDCHTAYAGLGIIANDEAQDYVSARRHFAKARSLIDGKKPEEFSIELIYSRYDATAQVDLGRQSRKTGDAAAAKRWFDAAIQETQEETARAARVTSDELADVSPAEARDRKAELANLQIAEARARIGLADLLGCGDSPSNPNLIASRNEFLKAQDCLRAAHDLGSPEAFTRELDKSLLKNLEAVQDALARRP